MSLHVVCTLRLRWLQAKGCSNVTDGYACPTSSAQGLAQAQHTQLVCTKRPVQGFQRVTSLEPSHWKLGVHRLSVLTLWVCMAKNACAELARLVVKPAHTCMVVECGNACPSRCALGVPQQGCGRRYLSCTPAAVVCSNQGHGVTASSTGLGTTHVGILA
jgi:hypothetical protein